jgi:hypothetical protein
LLYRLLMLERPDTEPATLPEPYGSLLAFLGDLHEQAAMFRAQTRDPAVQQVLDDLSRRLVSMALVVVALPNAVSVPSRHSGS